MRRLAQEYGGAFVPPPRFEEAAQPSGTAARDYLPQRQSGPHLQFVQVQVGLQRSFCSFVPVMFILLSCCEEDRIRLGGP
jgi:hypothetical protein